MTKRNFLLLLTLTLLLHGISRAQGNVNFSGTWKLAKIDPPVDPRTGRAPGGTGGEASDPYAQSVQAIFAQAPQMIIITQAANQITVQLGSEKNPIRWTTSRPLLPQVISMP